MREATQFALPCEQASDEVNPGQTGVGDEDCLYLNVIAPADRNAPLPVIVFIHGGAWITGDSNAPIYNTPALPTRGPAIVVAINYRLGALGFLALSELAAEDPDHTTGNYGLLDQVAALHWVHDNIAAFGGDPAQVLVWGQSAGGASALMHLASPRSQGLFRAAFAQSGGLASGRLLSRAEAAGASYAAALGCSGGGVLACLRAVPASNAEAIPPAGYTWGPTIDGVVLPASPPAMFAAGTHNHATAIIGTTANEYANPKAFAIPQASTVIDDATYRSALAQNFGTAHVDAIVARYPITTTPANAYIAALSDARQTCAARTLSRSLAAHQTEPVYRYLFTHTDSSGPRRIWGPAHGNDFAYWFATFLAFTPTQSEQALALTMSADLLELARTASSTAWPRYDASEPTLVLDDTVGPEPNVRGDACDFWDSITQT